jgi:SPP1 family phage portal protein
MKLLVDEKIGYFLGNPPNITAESLEFQDLLISIFDEDFDDILNDIGVEAACKGIAWLHVYITDEGEETEGRLAFRLVPSEQVIPVWSDAEHKTLEAVIRRYVVETYAGRQRKFVAYVEWWDAQGVVYYVMENGRLVPDTERTAAGSNGHFSKNGQEYGWGRIPFIPFKNNSKELNDLRFVKPIIDAYDLTVSDAANAIEELRGLIYVVKGYSGSADEADTFLHNLKYYGLIFLDGGMDGSNDDVKTIESRIDIQASEAHLNRLKKDFYQFGQGVDMDTDRFGAAPSGVALEFIYSGLKLKVDNLERKVKAAFRSLFWFASEYLKITGQGAFDPNTAVVTFNRAVITNAAETVDTIGAAIGYKILSVESGIMKNPLVEDVTQELEKLRKDADESVSLDRLKDDGADQAGGEDPDDE